MVALDTTLFRLINGWSGNPLLDSLFNGLTIIGKGGAVWLLLALVLMLGAGRLPGLRRVGHARWRAVGLVLVGALAAAGILEAVLKELFGRPRPFVTLIGVHVVGALPSGLSFPSGHTLSSFAAATVLLVALQRASRRDRPLASVRAGWAAEVLAALIGFSRVWVGQHYPFDVLAGAILGIVVGWGAWALFEYLMLSPSPSRRSRLGAN